MPRCWMPWLFCRARRFFGEVPVGIYRSKLVIFTVDKPLHFWYTVNSIRKSGGYLHISNKWEQVERRW